MIVRELAPLERFIDGGATGARGAACTDPARTAAAAESEEARAREVGSSMRAVAPPMQSFAMGRRR